jgi:hypothetical protein
VQQTDLSRTKALCLVVLLTLIGGVLRLASLDRPVVWGDEARTFGRVFTSWQNMLGLLNDAGFMPGSYVSQWWVGQGMPVGFKLASSQPSTNPADAEFGARPGEVVVTKRLAGGPIALEPKVIRAIPTVCGILMLPTMYFFARRLVNRKLSVGAVAFCALSAYLLVYSRDAKMYMQLMFATTLHLGCFLWWLRVTEGKWEERPRTLLAWLCWVASGLLMMSFQMIGAVVLAIELLVLLSMPRVALWYVWPRSWKTIEGAVESAVRWPAKVFNVVAVPFRVSYPAIIGFVLGLVIIGSAPMGYYTTFNRFDNNVLPQSQDDQVDVDAAGLPWVRVYVQGRDGLNLFLFDATAWLTGWEWPRPDWWDDISPDRRTLLSTGSIAILLILLSAMIPWRAAMSRLQNESAFRHIHTRPMVWIVLGVWLACYSIYCVSFRANSPLEVVGHLLLDSNQVPSDQTQQGVLGNYVVDAVRGNNKDTMSIGVAWDGLKSWSGQAYAGIAEGISQSLRLDRIAWWKLMVWMVALVVTMVAFPVWTKPGAKAWSKGLAVAVAVMVLSWLVYLGAMPLEKPVFMPRYISVIYPLLVVGVIVLIARVPTLALRSTVIALLVVMNGWQYANRVWGESEPPTDRMARDLYDDRKNNDVLTITNGVFRSGAPGDGNFRSSPMRYYFWLLARDRISSMEMHTGTYDRKMGLDVIEGSPEGRIRRAVRDQPELTRVVLWMESAAGRPPRDRSAVSVLTRAGFELKQREVFNVFDHWTWRALYTTTRMEFVRSPSTKPASREGGSD